MGWQHVLAALVLSHVAVSAWAREAGTGARTAASAWRDATPEALPGWVCLGRIRAVGGIYLEKGGRLTRISTDPLLAAELERTP